MPLSPEQIPPVELASGASALQEAGVAFDPQQAHLDLSKEEKRRTTALFMAIHAYNNLIIKDAEMYHAIAKDRERNDGPTIQPATMDAMVDAALQFDDFISGRLQERIEAAEPTDKEETPDAPQS